MIRAVIKDLQGYVKYDTIIWNTLDVFSNCSALHTNYLNNFRRMENMGT